MEETVMMWLSPQASVINQEERIGVSIDGCKIWARDKVQTAILNEIACHSRTIAELERLVGAIRDGPAGVENDALALVDFILTFGNAIEDRGRI